MTKTEKLYQIAKKLGIIAGKYELYVDTHGPGLTGKEAKELSFVLDLLEGWEVKYGKV